MIEGLSDKELIICVRNGNDHAFDVIYKRYHRTMYLYAYKLLKDPDAAADIVQGCFIKLWEYTEFIPLEGINVKSYLYSMVRNRVVNYIRDNKSRLVHNYRIVIENDTTEELDFIRHLEEITKQDELNKAIDALPPQQRKIIQMRLDGMSNRQIADEEHLSVNTVNVHYRLGLKKLVAILKIIPLIITILC